MMIPLLFGHAHAIMRFDSAIRGTDMIPYNESEDIRWMSRALGLARNGEGFVEPNPMVGCVIVSTHFNDAIIGNAVEVIGEGWHRSFGKPHAEVEAIRDAQSRGKSTEGATAYVTLEPCCHDGKTPPCTLALLEAGIRRVVVAMCDPFNAVNGGGVAQLRDTGVEVTLGCLEAEARELNSPYLTRIEKQRPWVIAKWAMTLDGKIATRSGSSRWISSESSRLIAHRLRARSDAVMIGSRTAITDDPLLTARVNTANTEHEDLLRISHRTPLRVVFDSNVLLPQSSRLAQTAHEVSVLVAVSRNMLDANVTTRQNAARLAECGCEILPLSGATHHERMTELLRHLADRSVTNLLVEGGGTLLGMLFDLQLIDEVHVFIATKLIGGLNAACPIEGLGVEQMRDAILFNRPVVEIIGTDIYCHSHIVRTDR